MKVAKDTQELKDQVEEIISEQLGRDKEEVTINASITDDLGGDSLDTVELVIEFEKEYDIKIPDKDADKLTTPVLFINYLARLMGLPPIDGVDEPEPKTAIDRLRDALSGID